MESFILAWVLVVVTPHSHEPGFISEPFADLESCERVLNSVRRDANMGVQCVQVRIPVIEVPRIQEACKAEE